MKTKQIISLALMLALLVTVITGCGTKEGSSTNNNEESTSIVSAEMKENEESKSTGKSKSEKKTHSEYVKTYFVYAEQGAVVTWFDSKTGEYSYKGKCEKCGKTESGTHNGLRGGYNTTYSASYTCQNAQCSEWGKSQIVKIGCKVTGEWIEVDD